MLTVMIPLATLPGAGVNNSGQRQLVSVRQADPLPVIWNLQTAHPVRRVNFYIDSGDHRVSARSLVNVAALLKQISFPILRKDSGSLPSAGTNITLYATVSGYRSVAQRMFAASEVPVVVQQTGGFASGSNVFIPVYKYRTKGFLVNTLTHELTHVLLNQQGIARMLPTWMNEGYAWYNGLAAQSKVDPQAVQALKSQLLKQLAVATEHHTFLPLSANERQILNMNHEYNVEFADYMAVQGLISGYGVSRFKLFLQGIRQYGLQSSFERQYQMSLASYEADFYTMMMGQTALA
jgi:hypothetical protein